MSYSKEDFERFSKKLEEIRKEQKDDFIAPDAWQDIAEEIGFPASELKNIQNGYKTRGIGHIQYQNWEEALKELENYLIFNPLNAEANALMAEAYLGKWLEDERKEDSQKARMYADKCLTIDPQYKKAFQIIQQLNRPEVAKKRERNKGGARKPSWFSKEQINVAAFVALVFLVMASVFVYEFYFYKAPLNITFFETVANDKEIVTWMLTYDEYDSGKSNFQIQILNAETGELITRFPVDEQVQDYQYIQGKFYCYLSDKNDFEGRDAFTGKLVDNKDILQTHFKELAQGIGQIYFSSESIQLKRKDGEEFSYRPEYNLLLSKQEVNELDYYNKSGEKWIYKYNWTRFKNDKNPAQNQFFLYKKLEKPDYKRFNADSYANYGTPENTKFSKRIGFKSPVFLEAVPLYADSAFFLVKHKSEISEEAKWRLTAMNEKGDVLWEMKEEDSDQPMLWAIIGSYSQKQSYFRHKNTLLFSAPYIRAKFNDEFFAGTIALDAQTGKLLWKYSPQKELE